MTAAGFEPTISRDIRKGCDSGEMTTTLHGRWTYTQVWAQGSIYPHALLRVAITMLTTHTYIPSTLND